jgi:hypothetical protein
MTSPTPARVSGPGALSQRTDGGQPLRHITDARYGEDKANIAQQKMAPLANSAEEGAAGPSLGSMTSGAQPPPPAGAMPGPAAPPQAITPFDAPTTMPDQPVTQGMTPFGQQPPPPQAKINQNQISQALAPYFAADDTGVLAEFAWKLSQMGI